MPKTATKTFLLTSAWLGLDETPATAESAEAALAQLAAERDLRDLEVFDHAPAEDGDPETWWASFRGQEWSDGDFNTEHVTVEAATTKES